MESGFSSARPVPRKYHDSTPLVILLNNGVYPVCADCGRINTKFEMCPFGSGTLRCENCDARYRDSLMPCHDCGGVCVPEEGDSCAECTEENRQTRINSKCDQCGVSNHGDNFKWFDADYVCVPCFNRLCAEENN